MKGLNLLLVSVLEFGLKNTVLENPAVTALTF
jgi:hypothetical protein